jgi:hypothetical protein
VACFLSLVEEYPGIYSLNGVKAINNIVKPISPIINKEPVTKTFSLLSLKDIFSSKVLSLSITKRYLCSSLRFISFLFFFFLAIVTKINLEIKIRAIHPKNIHSLGAPSRCGFSFQIGAFFS